MTAAPETPPPIPSQLRLTRSPRPPADLRQPPGLEATEETMHRLCAGAADKAAVMARDHLAAGGKRLRARLALCATDALGGSLRDGIAWAAAVELLHNATLVHDDIQDGDELRRGRPTLWAKHGTGQAINAGDFMLMLPYLSIATIAPPFQPDLSRGLAEHAVRTVRGQIEEMEMLPTQRFDREGYRHAIEGKTGALIGLPIFGAAILGGRSRAQALGLSDAFATLGVLFQLQDDVLDLYGDKGRGQRGCDLYEGKVSALVVEHLERCPEDRDELVNFLRTPRGAIEAPEVDRWIEAFRRSGSLDAVLSWIGALAETVFEDAALAEEPDLHRLAVDLAQLALQPISHLVPIPRISVA